MNKTKKPKVVKIHVYKECYVCRKMIDVTDSSVRYMYFTINEAKKILEEYYCHLECYRTWFNERQMTAMNALANDTLMHLQPMIKQMQNQMGVMGKDL